MSVFDCTVGKNSQRARELGAKVRVGFTMVRDFEAKLVWHNHKILFLGKGETAQAACDNLETLLTTNQEYQTWLA
jgi:hypothetical protein